MSGDRETAGSSNRLRLSIVARGAVQGVGFRPFVYRLANELGLEGWVSNSMAGVHIEVEGPKEFLDAFLIRLSQEKPPRSFLQSVEASFLDPVEYSGFEIRESTDTRSGIPLILPDIATCPDCLREVFNIGNRRYLYPFTNCTNCGPRYSIIESLPYDRPGTSMKQFDMCPACRHEYADPGNRRFHAQPNACPECGPHLELWNASGKATAIHREALLHAVKALREGKVLALKGLGGFQLLVDARNDQAVRELRRRKHRDEKPFAVMVPSLKTVKELCSISPLEERLLLSPESPIVLLDRCSASRDAGKLIAASVAPGNPTLGLMLPYTPLHHLLLRDLGFPIVATSGNRSDEPICTDEHEALDRLQGIADLFLVHNRPIVRHVDDSVVRVVLGRELVLRRARGFAPLPVILPLNGPPNLAVGAHLKNTVALASETSSFVSQHIGDLESQESFEAFRKTIDDLKTLLGVEPATIICDAHPDYLSTKYAEQEGNTVVSIQHHYAHLAACMAENQLEGPLLGVTWDGTGYGSDGTIWGGEFLLTSESSFDRVATFKSFHLPGGDQAMREPRRAALGILFELFGESIFHDRELLSVSSLSAPVIPVIRDMLLRNINAPKTSSVGRLFDAVASMVGLRHVTTFEGQAAMELEYLAAGAPPSDDSYDFLVSDLQVPFVVDWTPMIIEILKDVQRSVPQEAIAQKFHNTLCEIILSVCRRVKEPRIVLTGGCFQNRYLLERSVRLLTDADFRVSWHQRIPPNDGGISLGQLYAARRAHILNVPSVEPAEPTYG
ncbi:MAG: carbamoyltransferase HypF [Bacteroidota bacterium]